jgi:phytanoyl-CoA hydroxylase
MTTPLCVLFDMEGEIPSNVPTLQTKFTTSEGDHIGDDYFLTSGDKIRYFLDEDAIDENGNLTRDKDKSVNKIGHGMCLILKFIQSERIPPALHQLDPVFRQITLQNDRLKALVRDLQFHRDPVGKDV